MFNRNKGFTMIELLVVMIIIVIIGAMQLTAIIKGRARANIESAKAEMVFLSSSASIIMMDTGQYLRLVDYPYQSGTLPDPAPICPFYCDSPTNQPTDVFADAETDPGDSALPEYIEPTSWNGPYHAYSARDQLRTVAPTVGSYPAYDSDAASALPAPGVNEWDNNDFPDGTP